MTVYRGTPKRSDVGNTAQQHVTGDKTVPRAAFTSIHSLCIILEKKRGE